MSDARARVEVEVKKWMFQTCPHDGRETRVYKHACPDCLLALAAAQRAEEREAIAPLVCEGCARKWPIEAESQTRGVPVHHGPEIVDTRVCQWEYLLRARREGLGGAQ